MGELGDLLRQSREQLGLTLDDIQASTHIQSSYLQALEEECFGDLPNLVVRRGFLRNYASVLNLDPNYVLDLHDGHDQHTASSSGPTMSEDGIRFKSISMARPARISPDLLIGLLLIATLVGVVVAVFYVYQDSLLPLLLEPDTTPPAATADAAFILPTPTPAPTRTPTPTTTPIPLYYTGVTVELLITDESWVQVLVDDVKAFEGILQVGEQRHWTGTRQVAVRVGNAGGVEAIVNGESLGAMGESAQVIDQVWVKMEEGAAFALTPTPTVVTDQ